VLFLIVKLYIRISAKMRKTKTKVAINTKRTRREHFASRSTGMSLGSSACKHSHWMSSVILSFAKNLKCRVRTKDLEQGCSGNGDPEQQVGELSAGPKFPE